MKIHLLVQSPLLQKTLESYLQNYLCDFEDCDFVIANEVDESISKPICLIDFSEDADILRPIYKESLMNDLAKFNAKLKEIERIDMSKFDSVLDLNELDKLKQSLDSINGISDDSPKQSKKNDIEKEIDNILQDFKERLYSILTQAKP